MKRAQIDQLVSIVQMLRDRDLSELAKHHAQRDLAKNARTEFSEQAKSEDAVTAESLGYRKDHELPRRLWRDRRMYALSHYEARAAALVETQRRVAAKSFGRAAVLEQIAERMKQDPKRR